MIIDAYSHYAPRNSLLRMKNSANADMKKAAIVTQSFCDSHTNFINLEERLRDLDTYGISCQVTVIQTTIDPNVLPLKPEESIALSRVINDDMEKLMQGSRGRIFSLGVAPLTALEEGGLEEMTRAVRDLGLKGFVVPTNVQGAPLDHFKSFWERVTKLDAPVYLHPVDQRENSVRSYENDFDLMHVFGWPFETALALSRLVFSGILEAFPGLKVVGHHLGGMIPFLAGRIIESYDKGMKVIKEEQKTGIRLSKTTFEYFRQFYYDTAVGGNASAVKCGYEIFGADRLLFATDYPWGPDGGKARLSAYPDMVMRTGIPKDELNRIFETNARKLLKL